MISKTNQSPGFKIELVSKPSSTTLQVELPTEGFSADLSFIIFKTQTGRAMRAVSTRPDMTPLMGINNNKINTKSLVMYSINLRMFKWIINITN